MEPDLSASITMHPHPFRSQSSLLPPRPSPQTPPTFLGPASPPAGAAHPLPPIIDHHADALSTGTDAMSGADDKDPVARHPSSAPAAADLEIESQVTNRRLPRSTTAENDPYGLASAYKTDAELEQIKANTSRKRYKNNPQGTGGVGGGVGGGSGSGQRVLQGVLQGVGVGGGGVGEGAGNNNIDKHSIDGNVGVGRASLGSSPPGNREVVTRSAFGRGTGFGSGRLVGCVPLPRFGRSALQARRVQGFYQAQNETIERLLKSVEEHRAAARQEQGDDQLRYQIAVYGSFAANLALAALQVYGAVSSGSLSLFTTMADAIFDPLSNLTLIITARAVQHVDPSRFPSGKARLETVGNIVFCFLMTAVSCILIAFSAQQLAQRRPDEAPGGVNGFHLPSVIAVAVAFCTKLVLFLYTWAIKDRYSNVRILWQDHRNDLLINGFGLLTSVGGSKLAWWIDPSGAIVLSLVVSFIWLRTAFAEFMLLVGVVASIEIQQLITYVCVTHAPAIRQIDTVRVYHSGPRLIAEVDVVMDPTATLQATHDVAEALQFKLESLPDVERAYVHVDYETTHKPEHAYKKDL